MPVMMKHRDILISWPGGGLSVRRSHKPFESDGNYMLTMDEMKAFLPGAEADFQLAGQDAPLLSTSGAEKYDELGKAEPTFIGGK